MDVEIADFVKGQKPSAESFPVVVSSDQTDINIKINDVRKIGSHENLQSGGSLIPSGETNSVFIGNVNKINIVYQDTSTTAFDGLDVLLSGDGTNYYLAEQLYPFTDASGTIRYAYSSLDVGGFTRIKLRNNSSTDTYANVSASVFGSL